MSGLSIALIGSAATIIAAFIGYLGIRLTRKSQQEAAVDARWAKMLENQREDFEALLKPMRESIDNLESKVDRLTTELRTERRRFRSAMHFIRKLLRFIDHHVPGAHPPEIPAELVDDL